MQQTSYYRITFSDRGEKFLLFSQLSVIAIIMNITRTAMVGNLLKGLLENHTAHPSFGSLAHLQVQFNNVAAIIVFFSWVKV